MKKLACLFLSMGLAVGLTAAASAETVLRFATDSSEDYVSTVQIYKFADEVKEKLEIIPVKKVTDVLKLVLK